MSTWGFNLRFLSSILQLSSDSARDVAEVALVAEELHRFLSKDHPENLATVINFSPSHVQKQPSRGALKKSCSENMQKIYRRTHT